ncbi:MAG: hypothetical protein IKS19_00650 [Clostridia bacterium]|nr:hypothetical protein [Clostridia bacterium]
MEEKSNKFLMYKDKPLVRCGNTIYYGDMNDDYVVMLQVMSTDKHNDIDISGRVLIQLLSTDPDKRPKERIVKKSEKVGLYNAMDIGAIWLQRALNEEKK